jgi:ATP-binding cassette, subfamily F, member 3
MISVDNLTKSFGNRLLFDDISFRINRRERVGLVGRNGHGKTTLFRMIMGQDSADSGAISIPKNYRIGYVTQEIDFTQNSVLEEGMLGLPESMRTYSWEAEKILSGLGFSSVDMKKHPTELSGGYQVRLNLAKVLLSIPDLLLLDEPTNYLDIASIRWIKKYLQNWPREIFVITHDRGFMDSIVTHIIGIHRLKIRKVAGNTEKYYLQIAQEEEIYEKTRVNEERRRKEIEEFIARFRAKARLAGLVQSRIKTLSKQEKNSKREKFRNLDFSFRYKPFIGKTIATVNGLSFYYEPSQQLISDFNISIGSKDRICIIGRNGAGKTTLLKLLAGALAPISGEVSYHSETVMGYYEQTNVQSLQDDRTVEEEILYSATDIDRQTARNVCGIMLFEGDSALKKISVLSGGEKSRVMIGKILCTPVNILLLDEPTNHFDIESCDALLTAIDEFDGAVIMVTHNEMFLHAIADKLIVFQHNEIQIFDGDYQRFLDKGGWGDSEEVTKDGYAPELLTSVKPSKKEIRRLRSELVSERSRSLKPLESRMMELENQIDANEKKLQELYQQMQRASENKEGKLIVDVSRSIYQYQKDIDLAFEELENLSFVIDEKKLFFEARVQELNDLEATQNS